MNGNRIAGTFSDMRYREVTIDSNYVSSPVPGGETWCVPDYSFDTSIN